MTRYLYQNKKENMTINYIDKEKRVGRTIYTQLDEDGLPLLMKAAQIKDLKNNDVNLNLGLSMDSAKAQEELLNKILK